MPDTDSDALPRRKRLRSLFLLQTIVAFTLVAIAIFCNAPLSWRLLPFPIARSVRHSAILNDTSLVGMTPDEVTAYIGSPTRNEGPYSWWWLESNSSDISSLMFHYGESLKVVRVSIPIVRDGYNRQNAPVSFHLETWKNADPETRHKMNIDLMRQSEAGAIPPELATLEDVERAFPNATFAHVWTYTTGFLVSVEMNFAPDGHIIKVWEGT